ncbi:glycosyltransferase family 9 protein [Psychromonas sp. Urea-02u-13]|uniref:glycosyltransferase family 9 protein n=1 Tax=Psychromonas sp. Urea-02u-13 TaxID=2058326 RepID=UPI000C33F109|nr:glycosyltransferase family 9 protein [Psychromonas sp. Urea-02u-13]PKG38098.1 ADP-heptose--LPS heptosyltransferase I [Psychromonas sp. Urea-02u-13]
MSIFSSAPNSICILRLSAIGDACNAVSVVQSIQQQWPETKITWIMGKLEAQLLGDLPDIEVITFDKQNGFKGYLEIWKLLKGRQFDALLHMQSALRASIVSLGIKAKYRLGFDLQRSSDMQSWFINHKVPSPSSPHVLDGFKAFALELGIKERPLKWNIPIKNEAIEWAEKQINTKQTVVIVPAASKAFKNWHAKGYAEVIEYLHQQGLQVILAGSPAPIEIELAEQITQLTGDKAVNLVGKSSLKEMLALIQQAKLVIAPDTGPAHMAVAVDTPVIGLYAHHNPQRTGPYNYRDFVVSAYQEAIEDETGKKLSEQSWRARVKDEVAMNRITSEQVIKKFKQVSAQLDLQELDKVNR